MKNEKIERLFTKISSSSTAESFLERRIEFKESKIDTKRSSSNDSAMESQLPICKEGEKVKILFPSSTVQKQLLGWKKIGPIGSGLANLGNTCFLNSVLQCLTYTTPLVNYLIGKEHFQRCRISGFCAFCELERQLPQALTSHKSVVYQKNIAINIKCIGKHFRHGRQEDAHEFLRYLIDSLQKSFLLSYNSQSSDFKVKESSLLYQIFRSSVTCLSCKHRLSFLYHPRCNGIVEREVKTTIQVLCKQLHGFKELWCKQLSAVEFSLNSKTQPHFQFSPFALMFMSIPLVPFLNQSEEIDSSSFSASESVHRYLSYKNRLSEHYEAQVSRATRSADRFLKTKELLIHKNTLFVIMSTS